MARPQSELTKFILSLSASLPTKEVIARAKDKGFTTTESNVHRVRNAASKGKSAAAKPSPQPSKAAAKPTKAAKATKPSASASAKPSKAAPAAKAVAKTAGLPNKSDYVRSHPSLTAKDLVAKAKGEHISIDESYVYKVRGRSHTGPKRGPGRPRRDAAVASPLARSTARGDTVSAFQAAAAALVLEHGIPRAEAILAEVSGRIRSAVSLARASRQLGAAESGQKMLRPASHRR